MLLLHDHRIETSERTVVSSAALEGPGIPDGFRLELRWHGADNSRVRDDATPFLPVLGVLASSLGADLTIDAVVDRAAAQGAERTAAVLGAAYGRRPSAVNVVRPAARRRRHRGPRRRGLFFSRGVDSMSSLVTLGDQVDVLLGLDWVDLPYGSPSQADIWRSTCAAAVDLGIPLVRLTTNARDVLDPVASWNDTHGATLVSCALLAIGAGDVLISSTHQEANAPAAHGDNRALLESFSTSYASVRQVAAAASRAGKCRLVADDAAVLRWLKVCWEAEGDGNCGTCSKCLLTMSCFADVDRLDRVASAFRAPLSAEAVAALDLSRTTPGSVQVVADEVRGLREGPVREAWEAVLRAATMPAPDEFSPQLGH